MGNYDYSTRKAYTNKPYEAYGACTITVSGVSDYSVKDNTSLFDVLTYPVELVVRNGSQDITVKFNSNTNDSVPVYADTDWGVSSFAVSDLFVTVSGSCTITIFTLGWS